MKRSDQASRKFSDTEIRERFRAILPPTADEALVEKAIAFFMQGERSDEEKIEYCAFIMEVINEELRAYYEEWQEDVLKR